MLWPLVKNELTFEKFHRYSEFRVEHDERVHGEPHWKRVERPYRTGAGCGTNNFKCADPTHHTRDVAQHYVIRSNAASVGPHPLTKPRDVRTGLAKFVPGRAGKQVKPVVHGGLVFTLMTSRRWRTPRQTSAPQGRIDCSMWHRYPGLNCFGFHALGGFRLLQHVSTTRADQQGFLENLESCKLGGNR